MTGPGSARVIVAGAGALGSSIAFALALDGAQVVLADPAPLGDNASGVAAGMLAPAFEAALDQTSRGHFELLIAARDLWPAFAEQIGGDIGLRRSGAVWLDVPHVAPRLDRLARELADIGAPTQAWSINALRRCWPGLAGATGGALFTPEDWRIEPRKALAGLRRAALSAGVRITRRSVAAFEPGVARLDDGETLAADVLVAATGAAASALAPEIAVLSPIKGQILHYSSAASDDGRPMVRCEGGYATPARDGLRIGATMEAGRSDRRVAMTAAAPLARLASRLFPALTGSAYTVQAGVRAATADGLPLVGPSLRDGVFLAVGARRNGWLLAPLVARMLAAYLAGRDPGPFAGVLAGSRRVPLSAS
jgi:glycine oxidase